ncbi:MAG TPA: substrate-binding domain-containing protein [Pseudonocardiaceae bacterium]|nr:substrate-binding domain-containing protein [Pseudonocardiaceae bacterium]
MSLAETAQSIVDVLGSNEGTISLGIAAVVAFGSPLVDRLLIRRKRIQYKVLYNSKIGLTPILFDRDEPAPSVPTNPQLPAIAELLEYLSVVIIRIRNTGSYDIAESDFEPPLSFTFPGRVVWDARVSEASDPQLRRHVRENLEFFTNAGDAPRKSNGGVDEERKLAALRKRLGTRMTRWLAPSSPQTATPTTAAEAEPQWHGVRLTKLWMHRQQSFILVLVLRETDEKATEISKKYEVTGGHSTGKTIIDEKRQHRFGWPLVATAIGVMLVGALLATLIIGRPTQTANPNTPCAAGTVQVDGSTAFGPAVQTVATRYMAQCNGAVVNVDSSGSIDGVRALEQGGSQQAANLVALSDGATDEPTPGLHTQLVAVLVYSVVINKSVGIDALNTQQLTGIYSGLYTNWQQLGGPNLPIRIVGRGENSGTRRAFERYVLNGSEGVLSSDSCLTKDRVANAPTIRCERDTTEDLINTVSTVPGAIGYGDVTNDTTKNAVRGGQIVTVKLNGLYPQVDSLPNYPFWTVEYLYTRGDPRPGSPLAAFLDYLDSDSAQAALLSAGYTPCVPKDGVLNHLCTLR